MEPVTWLLPIVIVVFHGLAVWTWSRIFWGEFEPWLRQALSQHWGVRIIWSRTPRGQGWIVEGDTNQRDGYVSSVAFLVLMCGVFGPTLLTYLVMLVGLFPARLAPLLVVASIAVSASVSRRAGACATGPENR
jgi:hypothetical protein